MVCISSHKAHHTFLRIFCRVDNRDLTIQINHPNTPLLSFLLIFENSLFGGNNKNIDANDGIKQLLVMQKQYNLNQNSSTVHSEP